MDKSFNDQELSDIMKEIEALEDDFTTVEDKAASPVMEELAKSRRKSLRAPRDCSGGIFRYKEGRAKRNFIEFYFNEL